MEKQLKILGNLHINYKDWQKYGKYAIANGIKTFAELEMYCKIHNVKSELDLFMALGNDCVEIAYENYKKQVNRILKGVQNGNY
jgi:hypothetical protein